MHSLLQCFVLEEINFRMNTKTMGSKWVGSWSTTSGRLWTRKMRMRVTRSTGISWKISKSPTYNSSTKLFDHHSFLTYSFHLKVDYFGYFLNFIPLLLNNNSWFFIPLGFIIISQDSCTSFCWYFASVVFSVCFFIFQKSSCSDQQPIIFDLIFYCNSFHSTVTITKWRGSISRDRREVEFEKKTSMERILSAI